MLYKNDKFYTLKFNYIILSYNKNLGQGQQNMFDWIKKQTSKITDNQHQYKFYVKHEPQVIDSSSTLTLTAFTDKNQKANVPCTFKWFRIRNGLTNQVPQFKGSSFICEPSDVGSIIQAQVTSNDRQHSGTAIIQYGPVKLDLMLKKQMESALASGVSTINAYLSHKNQQRQCQIKIFQQTMKICPVHSQLYYSFDYCISEPRLEVAAKDPTKLHIIFNAKYEKQARKFLNAVFNQSLSSSSNFDEAGSMTSSTKVYSGQIKYEIKFTNRKHRDIFLFITKAFFTKKQMKDSAIINKIQKIDYGNDQTFNYALEIQSLRSDLIKMFEVNRQVSRDKSVYQQQIRRLEKEIEQIIITYTRIVEDKCRNQKQLNQSYSVLSNKRDQIVGKKYRNLESQNKSLNERLRNLTQEVDKIRFNRSVLKQSAVLSSNQIVTSENNAFKKKPIQQKNFNNILDQLNESDIIKEFPEQQQRMLQKINQLNEDKKSLSVKLSKSFQRIDHLERKINEQQKSMIHLQNNPNQLYVQNTSAIHFTYGGNKHNLSGIEDSRHNISVANPEFQRMAADYKQVSKLNESLRKQNLELQKQLSSVNGKAKQLQKFQVQSDLLKMQIRKNKQYKNTQQSLLKKEVQLLRKQKAKLQEIVRQLQIDNNFLKSEKDSLLKDKSMIEGNYKRKIAQMGEQLDILRKNQDVLNRSQHLSMEMDSYNEEQVAMLKQHNQFLTSENQKLAKACEKYMADAKQSNKLRQQIMALKEQLNKKCMNFDKSQIIEG